MREHPLLMKGPLVRATLEGRKTQTRRPLPDVFNSPPDLIYGWLPPGEWKLFGATMERWGAQWRGTYPSQVLCPLGRAGDRLWVRETWAWPGEEGFIYRADQWAEDMVSKWKQDPNYPQVKWSPSIHMPRKACRLVLPLVSVRVERVQDITEEDAKAEGVEPVLMRGIGSYPEWMRLREVGGHQKAFELLWKQIYGDALWDANPWVWVAEWKAIEVSR